MGWRVAGGGWRVLGPLTVVAALAVAAPAQATPRCGTGDLQLIVDPQGGGAGSQFYDLILRNRSGHSCKTGGFPGVSLLDARRHQLGASAKRENGGSHRFTLRPNGQAIAQMRTRTEPCGKRSTYVRVIPPNERSSLTAKLHANSCGIGVEALRKDS